MEDLWGENMSVQIQTASLTVNLASSRWCTKALRSAALQTGSKEQNGCYGTLRAGAQVEGQRAPCQVTPPLSNVYKVNTTLTKKQNSLNPTFWGQLRLFLHGLNVGWWRSDIIEKS